MTRFKMTTKRYRALRAAAQKEADRLGGIQDLLAMHGNAERRLAEVQTERGILLNAIDALDSRFPMQAADAAQQALRELSEGED